MSRLEDIVCTTKVTYYSRSQAKRAWKRLRRQPGRRHLERYRCSFCHFWHLGNPPGHQTYIRKGLPTLTPHRPPAPARHLNAA